MAIDPPYLAAFLIGLSGGAHCFGMCGGIVGALTLGLPATPGHPLRTRLPYLLAYNGGRIISYMIAGALAGGVGAWATHLLPIHRAQLGLQLLAGLFMILLGLYLAGWQTVLGRLERVGGVLWRRIEPLGRRWLPVRTGTIASAARACVALVTPGFIVAAHAGLRGGASPLRRSAARAPARS